jgi:hypothetical protein
MLESRILRKGREVCCRPILLQKSPQRSCEMRIGNNRIDAAEHLNQRSASAPEIESILRGQMGKIFLQQYRSYPDVAICPPFGRFRG